MLKLIGISGQKRSGKGTIADYLSKEYYFNELSFAEPMRKGLLALDCPVQSNDGSEYALISAVIEQYGWDNYKESPYGKELRKLMQRFGTDFGREILGEDVWVNALSRILDGDHKFVISDVRFANEAQFVEDMGGETWLVTRAGHDGDDHPSEVIDFDCHCTIDNNGSYDDLYAQVDKLLDETSLKVYT